MKVSTMGAALAASFILAQAGSAAAAFSGDQLKCRATIAKVGTKLSSMIDKTLLACHKTRDTKIPSTDCSSIAAADVKSLVSKTEDAFRASVGGAKDACLGLVPADLGFDSCPAPCADDVPAINDFDDVADCVICQIREETFASVDAVMGSPTVPLGGIEAKCHATIGKSHGKLLSTVIKTRTKCQNLSDKEGGMDTTACAGVASDTINTARQKGADAILAACQPADLMAVDSCEGSDMSDLQNCVLDGAEGSGEQMYLNMYGEEPDAPYTWTQINGIFQASCASISCHTSGGMQGGLDMGGTSAANYAELVNATAECFDTSFSSRVVPGDAGASFLMAKLDHTQDCGDGMPLLVMEPLPESTRNRIAAWIEAGAPFN